MEVLQDIVRSIAVIILFAGFMEMLLPDTEMRKYIQVIVGLFVVVSLITPLAKLLDKENNFAAASWQYIPADTSQQAIDKGEKIFDNQAKAVQAETDKRIAAQINALAKLHNGVNDAEVQLVPSEKEGSVKVKIKLITENDLSAQAKSKLSQEVSSTVTAFFNYTTDNIEIAF